MDRRQDGILVRADQLHGTRFHRFRTLCFFPQHQHRLTQRGPFLLDPAGIGDQQVGLTHQIYKGNIVERFDEAHVGQAAEPPSHRFLHIGIEMHRIDDLDVGPLRHASQRRTDTLKTIAEALPSMRRHHNQLLCRIERRQPVARQLAAFEAIAHVQHRVDAGIAGHGNSGLLHAFR